MGSLRTMYVTQAIYTKTNCVHILYIFVFADDQRQMKQQIN